MIKVKNLNKVYPTFSLKDVSFDIPKGYIIGFLGLNGAGKTTTIKSMLNIVKPDSGNVLFFDKDIANHELEIKQDIGFILGAFDYYPKNKVKDITNIYRSFFVNWDQELYLEYIQKFDIDQDKRVCDLSAGMKVKYGLALALSHHAKILILDEPTSGLDPLAREDILDIFREIIQDGETSILFSTHITSDLDKCADFILMIKNGQIIAFDSKDNLIDNHRLICGNLDDLTLELRQHLIGYKKNKFGFDGLLKTEYANSLSLEKSTPNLEDIMIYYNLEVKND